MPALALLAAAGGFVGCAHRLGDFLGRRETRGVVADAKYVRDAVSGDFDIGGHAGQEAAVRVPRVDDHSVGHDICGLLAQLADLHDGALEALAGEGVDREDDGIAIVDAADIGLDHVGLDLDLREVCGDGEEFRDRLRGLYGLANLDLAAENDAVDGRTNLGALQLGDGILHRGACSLETCERRLQRHLFGLNGELCVLVGLFGLLHRLRRCCAFGVEHLCALIGLGLGFEIESGARQGGARIINRRLRLQQTRAVLVKRVLEGLGIDLGEHLVLLHPVVEVDIDRRDLA